MRAFVDDEAFDLVKLRRVGGVRVDAVGAARADHADRRLLGQHGAHLHRRGVGTQQHARAVFLRIEEEGVVHLAGRMTFGKIQLGEIVVVGLDVGPFGDGKSHVGEDRRQLVHHLAERMDPALLGQGLAYRQRDVDGLGRKPRVERGRFQDIAARGERLRDIVLGEVDRRSLRLALVRRHLAEGCEQHRDRALLAERSDADGFEGGFVAGCGDLSEDFLFKRCEVGHGFRLYLQRAAGCGRAGGKTSSKKPLTWPRRSVVLEPRLVEPAPTSSPIGRHSMIAKSILVGMAVVLSLGAGPARRRGLSRQIDDPRSDRRRDQRHARMRPRDEAVRGLRIRHQRRHPPGRRCREEMRGRLFHAAHGAAKAQLSARDAASATENTKARTVPCIVRSQPCAGRRSPSDTRIRR